MVFGIHNLRPQGLIGDKNNVARENDCKGDNKAIKVENCNNEHNESMLDRVLLSLCKKDIIGLEFNNEVDA